uniref:Uncharacterized protein n=1 Tax=Anguilla anguilla TaxID=7936 RepID=A0A0E9PFG0_ANGAN
MKACSISQRQALRLHFLPIVENKV